MLKIFLGSPKQVCPCHKTIFSGFNLQNDPLCPQVNWYQAYEKCRNYGLQLVTIESTAELEFIISLITRRGKYLLILL